MFLPRGSHNKVTHRSITCADNTLQEQVPRKTSEFRVNQSVQRWGTELQYLSLSQWRFPYRSFMKIVKMFLDFCASNSLPITNTFSPQIQDCSQVHLVPEINDQMCDCIFRVEAICSRHLGEVIIWWTVGWIWCTGYWAKVTQKSLPGCLRASGRSFAELD